MKNVFFLGFILILSISCTKQQQVRIISPDGNSTLVLRTSEHSIIDYEVKYGEREIILPSEFNLQSSDIDFSNPFKVINKEERHLVNEWNNTLGELSTVPDNYNEVKLYLESSTAKINIIARAYNEGVAMAYEIPEQNSIKTLSIDDEMITYNFDNDYTAWTTPKTEPGKLTAQGLYEKVTLTTIKEGCERPLLIQCADDLSVALAEAGLVDYARMSFSVNENNQNSIKSSLDGKLRNVKQDKITGAVIAKRTHEAKVVKELPFQSPWRVVMMAANEGQLLEHNYMLQNLNPPSAIADISWIKPGKVLREATLTTQGAFSAIDFVAAHNMQYVLFDAGWYGDEMNNASDATTITLDPKRSQGPFDMEAVTAYAKTKEIGVILYVNRRSLEKQLDDLLPLFSKWGIAGIKYGFVRVGDQDATAWLHDAAKKTADYKMIMDVHDEYRPTGFSRTYPNFLTQEGIHGDECSPSNEHTLITMFTRMLAGAADNTICYYNSRVETMGSHASQLAKSVCLFSPLQFLYWYDRAPLAPIKKDGLWGDTRNIGNEPELEFFDAIPTVWDETKVLVGEVGKIGVIARRSGEEWFIGGINGNTAQEVDLNLSFLSEGLTYHAKIYTDDESIKTRTRVRIEEEVLNAAKTKHMSIKANNGFTMHLVPN